MQRVFLWINSQIKQTPLQLNDPMRASSVIEKRAGEALERSISVPLSALPS